MSAHTYIIRVWPTENFWSVYKLAGNRFHFLAWSRETPPPPYKNSPRGVSELLKSGLGQGESAWELEPDARLGWTADEVAIHTAKAALAEEVREIERAAKHAKLSPEDLADLGG